MLQQGKKMVAIPTHAHNKLMDESLLAFVDLELAMIQEKAIKHLQKQTSAEDLSQFMHLVNLVTQPNQTEEQFALHHYATLGFLNVWKAKILKQKGKE